MARTGDTAELTPRTTGIRALTAGSQVSNRLDRVLAPRDQVLGANRPGLDVGATRLENAQSDFLNTVERIKSCQRAKPIEHQLWVLDGADFDAHPVFEVNDLQGGLGNDHAVTGPEAARGEVGVVQALFDIHLRVRAVLPSRLEVLGHEGDVVVGVALHLLINPLRGGALRPALQKPQQLVLSQRMRSRTLQSCIRRRICHAICGERGGRAVQPPVSTGG